MRHKSGPRGTCSEKLVKDIRRETRKRYSAEEKFSKLPEHGSCAPDSGPFDVTRLLLIPKQTWMSVACQDGS